MIAKPKINLNLIDLRRIVEDGIREFGDVAEFNNILLTSIIDPLVSKNYLGDQACIQDILATLVQLAVHTTLHGRVQVRVSVIHDEKNHTTLKLNCFDTGSEVQGDQHLNTTELRPSLRIVELLAAKLNAKCMFEKIEGSGSSNSVIFTLKKGPAFLQKRPSLKDLEARIVTEDQNVFALIAEQLSNRGVSLVRQFELGLQDVYAEKAFIIDASISDEKFEEVMDEVRRLKKTNKIKVILLARKGPHLLNGNDEVDFVLQMPLLQSELYKAIAS